MSDPIKHECGIAMIRLLQPLDYYEYKYGSPLYGLNKMHLLLQKMRNRGQDGAGLATIKLDPDPGTRYISRKRSNHSQPLRDLFVQIGQYFQNASAEGLHDADWLRSNLPFTGELLLGHLRYGTHGLNSIENCHPVLRQNNWISRNLVLAGNFNLTNVNELFDELLDLGQYPKEVSDTVTVLEKIGHFLDDEVQRLFNWFKLDGYDNRQITELIAEHLDVTRLLNRACRKFDGGFVMGGIIGHGDAFLIRDPHGIRPAYYYHDEEIVVAASERPAIQTSFNVRLRYVQELQPGHALIAKKDGRVSVVQFTEPQKRTSCSFERIYFSRGTDRDIYLERKKLGEKLTEQVLQAIDYDMENTVFSYVPNTAETAFLGLMQGLEKRLQEMRKDEILKLTPDQFTPENLETILQKTPRFEKIVVKDEKMRTFIADSEERGDLVSHVYDVTYGIVRNNIDTLVLLDDSIVRGTTLRDSIIRMVDRLHPKKIVFVSSSPQIRYPDCYGIDMSVLGSFVAFEAMISLLKERGLEYMLDEVYDRCLASETSCHLAKNEVKCLYDQFTYEEISDRISQILTPAKIDAEVVIIFQTIDGLHGALPETQRGDWYFSGNYPTSGGNGVVNRAFINYMEKKLVRAY